MLPDGTAYNIGTFIPNAVAVAAGGNGFLPTAHHWYAWHLSLMGRHGEAIAEMRKASAQ